MSTRAQKVKGFIRCRAIRFLSTANQFSIGKLLIQHTIAFLSVNQSVFQKALSVTEGSPSPLCLHVFCDIHRAELQRADLGMNDYVGLLSSHGSCGVVSFTVWSEDQKKDSLEHSVCSESVYISTL